MSAIPRYDPLAKITESCHSVSSLRERWMVSGTPSNAAGPIGRPATFFDGTNDYCVGTSAPNMQASCTVMCWVYVDATETTGIVFAKRDARGKGPTIIIDDTVSFGDVVVYDGNDVWKDTGTNVTADTWHHLVLVINAAGTSATIYLDGTERYTIAINAFTNNQGQPWSLGADDGGWAKLKGGIADFMAFDRILTSAEIDAIYHNTMWDYTQKEVSWWPMDSINPRDLGYAGNANHGTGTGLVAADDIKDGPFSDKAVQFNGADEKVDCGACGTVRTVAMMVKPDTTTEELVLLDTGKDIMVSGGTVTYTGLTATATFVDGVATTTMVAGKWQFLVCVLNANVTASNFEMATDGTNFGAISISDMRIFDEAMLQAQAQDLNLRIRRSA